MDDKFAFSDTAQSRKRYSRRKKELAMAKVIDGDNETRTKGREGERKRERERGVSE